MSSVLAAATAAKIQEIRASSLATMMSIIAAPGQANAAGSRPPGTAGTPVEAAPIRAVLVEMQTGTRALVQLAGGFAEVELPPALLRQAAADPSMLKPGSLLLLPPDVPARPVPGPATSVATPTNIVPSPPVLPTGAFPAGTLGAAVTRMTGLSLPAAEPMAMPVTIAMPTPMPASSPRTGIASPAAPASAMQGPAALSTGMLPVDALSRQVEAAFAMPAGRAMPLPASAPLVRSTPLPAGLPAPIAEAVIQSAARQLPLAPVLTGLMERLLAPDNPADPLPPLLRNALAALAPLRSGLADLATPEGLKQAFAQSGLFLESRLAHAVPGQAPADDLKSALTGIRQAARGDGGERGSSHAEIARLAEGGTERIKLMQLASLPAHPEIVRNDEAGQGFRVSLAVPLAPQGPDRPQTAVMGVMIEHQPAQDAPVEDPARRESNGDAQPFPWKVRIALDLEETGPVEAEIGLRGHAVSIQLWAEQPGMARLARQTLGDLHAALSGAAFEIVKLDVHDGRSSPRPSLPNPYLDRRP